MFKNQNLTKRSPEAEKTKANSMQQSILHDYIFLFYFLFLVPTQIIYVQKDYQRQPHHVFFFQFVLGFFTFFFPGAAMPKRADLLPWHTFFGMVIFLLAVCTAETGLVLRFNALNLGLNQRGLIVNFTGLLIFLFGVSVTLSVILPRGPY